MASKEEGVITLVFIILNFIEPILGIPTALSYLHYFSYTPATNITELTNQITGEAIALPSVVLNEIIDVLISTPLGIVLAMLLGLLGGSGGGGGGRTVHFSSGRTVTFRN